MNEMHNQNYEWPKHSTKLDFTKLVQCDQFLLLLVKRHLNQLKSLVSLESHHISILKLLLKCKSKFWITQTKAMKLCLEEISEHK